MIKIFTNEKSLPEKKYVFHVLLKEFLGLDFTTKQTDIEQTIVELNNSSQIIFNNDFFNSLNNSYSSSKLPKLPIQIESDFGTVTSLYGTSKLKISKNKIHCGGDIIASTFFMLTRWEEMLKTKRDKHNRFPASESYAHKNNLLLRPIVNEYVEFFWKILRHLGLRETRLKKNFTIIPTHDVDLPKMWWNVKDFYTSLLGALVKRRSIEEFKHLINLYSQKKIKKKDPFDTFDQLMDLSEKNGLTSHFFFMSGGTSNKDNFYKISHPFVKSLIRKIRKRGHKIGFHPSYNSYNNLELFKKEKNLLEEVAEQEINFGRQHFLRFDVTKTWSIWNDANMKWDSTISFADHVGFRSGVCYPFSTYDLLNRKKLDLIERPLIVMDGSLVTYQKSNLKKSIQLVQVLKSRVKNYNGEFVFLWHNSAFATKTWSNYYDLLKELYARN